MCLHRGVFRIGRVCQTRNVLPRRARHGGGAVGAPVCTTGRTSGAGWALTGRPRTVGWQPRAWRDQPTPCRSIAHPGEARHSVPSAGSPSGCCGWGRLARRVGGPRGQERGMETEGLRPAWEALGVEVAGELAAWRRAHPRATLAEIEGVVLEAVGRLQARFLEDLAQASAA